MSAHEGPTKLQFSYQSCSGCKWHEQKMMKSGRDPEYWHYCQHPDTKFRDFIIQGEPDGCYIGKDDHTPPWCPVTTPAPIIA